MKNLIILSYILNSLFSIAQSEEVKLSSVTENFYNTNFRSKCNVNPYTESSFNSSLEFIKRDIGSSKERYYSAHAFNRLIKDFSCDPTMVDELKKRIEKDRLPLHQANLDKILGEIKDFKKKGLSGSAQVIKYLNYKKINLIDDIANPKEVDTLYQTLQSENQKRKDSCQDVVNIKEPLSLDRPKNQDSIGWCYAYTASDLVAHALGKEPSAVYLGNLFNSRFLSRISNTTESGFITLSIEDVKSNGICLEKDLPSDDYRFSKDGKSLRRVYEDIINFRKKNPSIKTKEEMNKYCSDNKLYEKIQELFPAATYEQISRILLEKKGVAAFNELVKLSCPIDKDKELDSLQIESTVFGEERKLSIINEQLDKGNIIGIVYKARMLMSYKNDAFIADHASSIVGRRYNPKNMSCEYLLRNSWGKPCIYSEDYECKNGHIWIPVETFKYNNSILEVVYVEKK